MLWPFSILAFFASSALIAAAPAGPGKFLLVPDTRNHSLPHGDGLNHTSKPTINHNSSSTEYSDHGFPTHAEHNDTSPVPLSHNSSTQDSHDCGNVDHAQHNHTSIIIFSHNTSSTDHPGVEEPAKHNHTSMIAFVESAAGSRARNHKETTTSSEKEKTTTSEKAAKTTSEEKEKTTTSGKAAKTTSEDKEKTTTSEKAAKTTSEPEEKTTSTDAGKSASTSKDEGKTTAAAESATKTPASTAGVASGTSAAAASTGTLSASSDCTFTDAASAIAGKSGCTSIVLDSIAVPAGTTLDMTDLTDGTQVEFSGTTTFGYEEWSGPMISFSGKDIVITGASGHTIDGNGAAWWNGEGSNGGVTKPKFFYAHSLTGTSSITSLNVLNTPVQAFSVNSASGLTIADVTIDNSAGDSGGGHNTDGYDIGSSTDITITGAVVKNQDDCFAINSGTGITISGATCSGGHGISIGSVGGRDDNTVSTIKISDSSISDSANGVRIKTVSGATGSVSDVSYSGIKLSGITSYGIVIEQDYENGSPTGTPTDGVPITGLTISDVTGTVSGGTNVYILCAACSDWTWSGVAVTGGDTSTDCTGIPTGASC